MIYTYYMPKPNISFNFNPKIDSKAKLEKMVSAAYQANQKFFGKDSSKIKVTFLYKRSQMDKICKRKTQNWEVGHTFTQQNINHIAIFSPAIFNKVSSHPKSDFSYILIHEIAHIFTHDLLGFYYPKWLHEDLAGYVAKQYKIRPVRKIDDFTNLHDNKNWNKFYNYPQAFSFTKYLINKLGKKKLLQFLQKLPKTLGRHHYPKDFTRFFNEFFNADFDQLVFGWQQTVQ